MSYWDNSIGVLKLWRCHTHDVTVGVQALQVTCQTFQQQEHNPVGDPNGPSPIGLGGEPVQVDRPRKRPCRKTQAVPCSGDEFVAQHDASAWKQADLGSAHATLNRRVLEVLCGWC